MTDTGSQYTNDTQARVAFIIPHKGREEMLLQTLRSIAQLDRDGFAVEVHLVTQNDSVSDEIHAIPDIDLKVHYRKGCGNISASRNYGVRQTKASFIAFIDADVELSPHWLRTLLQELQVPGRVLVSAKQITSANPTVLERIRTSLSNVDIDRDVTFLPGRNLLVRRSDVIKVNGFPEHLETCEDYYFTHALSQHGALHYTSKTEYVHIGEDKVLTEMAKKEVWRGQSNIASMKGRDIPLREIPSFLVPPGMMFTLLSALLLAITGYFDAAFILIGLSLLPFVAYCIRLKQHVSPPVSWWDITQFYAYYFPARAIGTVRGIFGELTTDSHS